MKQTKPNLLDMAKRTIEECADCGIVDPETNKTLAIGMQLNNEISILHYAGSGNVYILEEIGGVAGELIKVNESLLTALQSLFKCIDEIEE